MLPYEIVTKLVFARAVVPDGYFGLGLPLADSVEEARWLLQRHPAARDIKLVA